MMVKRLSVILVEAGEIWELQIRVEWLAYKAKLILHRGRQEGGMKEVMNYK